MPYVNIKITKTGTTAEQKAELIKNPATTFVIIEEVETDNWGVGGETVTARNAKA
jgi:4-oxalocrotonate tautomerase